MASSIEVWRRGCHLTICNYHSCADDFSIVHIVKPWCWETWGQSMKISLTIKEGVADCGHVRDSGMNGRVCLKKVAIDSERYMGALQLTKRHYDDPFLMTFKACLSVPGSAVAVSCG